MTIKTVLIGFLLLGSGLMATAQTPDTQLRKKHFWLSKEGVAIDGYDPVSYFNGKPRQGKADITLAQSGITYRFADAKNRDAFKANPMKYEPVYGGWCSYAIGVKAEKVVPDPENFKIVNGKVNLFYKDFFSNTLTDWNEDEANLKVKADQNWNSKIYK